MQSDEVIILCLSRYQSPTETYVKVVMERTGCPRLVVGCGSSGLSLSLRSPNTGSRES